MAAGTFMVRGRKVRTGSTRRYVVFVMADRVWISKRSDSLETARRDQRMMRGRSAFAVVVVDTTTGEEV